MNESVFLARLWGITFVVVSLACLKQPTLLKKMFQMTENAVVTFLLGLITFMIGLAMVILHNIWVRDWRISLTILGWLTFIKGLDLLLLPKRMNTRWKKISQSQWRIIFSLLLMLGVLLSVVGLVAGSLWSRSS